jgi:hypothetical protein
MELRCSEIMVESANRERIERLLERMGWSA